MGSWRRSDQSSAVGSDLPLNDPTNNSIPFPSFYSTASTSLEVKPPYHHSHTWPPPSSALELQTITYAAKTDSTPTLPPISTPPPLDLTLTFTSVPRPSRPSHTRSPAESFSSINSVYGNGYTRSTRPSLSPVVEETSSAGSKSPRSAHPSDPSRTSAELSSRPKRDSSVYGNNHGWTSRRQRWSRLSTSELNHRSSSSWVLDDGTNNEGRGFLTFEDDLTRAILAIAPPHVRKAPVPNKKGRRPRWHWRFTRRLPSKSRSELKQEANPINQTRRGSLRRSCRSFRIIGKRALAIVKSLAPMRLR